jgi:hypothetical protein
MKCVAIASIIAVTTLVTAASALAGAGRESGAAESSGLAFGAPDQVAPYFYPRRLYAFAGNGYVRHHRRGWSH